ncbi:MAG: type II methionyl aminopeptidase [Candidatus Aenigmatarchaeota archaeon]|nr:MAG: type II methionyl aminopeptidase [Candidatus Aenigmarchaeota archaeon]
MEKEVVESYKKAKEISDKVLPLAKGLVKEDASILEIAEKIESKIKELGGKPAFPVNISINEIAAHYTPDINDTLRIKAGDLVKIDYGVQVNGYIWDRAFSVFIGEKKHPLIEASEKALKEALKTVKPGVKVFEISEVIEDVVSSFGLNPVRNLSGHGLERYNQHAYPSIPNSKNTIQAEIKDQAIAIEVFVTDGSGYVKESAPTLIYKFKQAKPVRMWEARKILEKAQKDFELLPFAKRWLKGIGSPLKIDLALRQLLEVDALIDFPVLKEISGGRVAQSEETIIVE